MAKRLDHDLRIRIIAGVDDGMPRRAAARRFHVSPSAVIKLTARYRATGSAKPRPDGVDIARGLEGERGMGACPHPRATDITTRALADELAERGIVVSHVSVWNLLRREKTEP